jgi:hypothetical protein
VRLPLIQVNNWGTTGVIQAANTGTPTTADIIFGPNIAPAPPADKPELPDPCTRPPQTVTDIPLGTLGTKTILLPSEITLPEPGCAYVGSVTVTGDPGAKLAILANQINASGSDRLPTYSAP